MIKRLFFAVIALAVVAGAAAAIFWQKYTGYLNTPVELTEERNFTIEKGIYFNNLVKELNAEAIIDQPFYLRVLSRLEPEMTGIKAGEYQLKPGMTPRQMLEKFVAGETLSYRFTIIEGMRFSELRAALAAETRLTQSISELSDQQIVQRLALDAQSPEGMFLAETYQFQRGMSDLDLLKRAHGHLEAELEKAWADRAKDLPLQSPYEGLILASIIEKETGVPDERAQIAGVFVRRLNRGMRLQTDPTVIYGMGDSYQGNIRRSDLRKPTPYNTYVIDGLPPTPISMVGPDAIHAAFNPEEGKALYFVARGDGSHYFSNTLSEHNKAVARFQLKRRENYRSSPGDN
ncbi:endolytic transglycosylase MltG [Marinobacterium sp. YM272]|uniref:endolytic transglycosylase MltG n=1 Tax=Marinobacterium sp. YM272 TaxID=3421654 RepID=UPI003D7F7531